MQRKEVGALCDKAQRVRDESGAIAASRVPALARRRFLTAELLGLFSLGLGDVCEGLALPHGGEPHEEVPTSLQLAPQPLVTREHPQQPHFEL